MAFAREEPRRSSSEADSEQEGVETGRRIEGISRLDLRTYVCGPRMRIFSAAKSVLSIVYATLLLNMLVNFKIVDEELESMDRRTAKLPWDSTFAEVEAYEATRVAERAGRAKYVHALWTALILCFFHAFASGVTVLFSCLSDVRNLFGHLAHLTWWMVFATTILIPTVTSVFYFALLPRTVNDAFGQLVRTAKHDYNAIIPLEMKFNCCSVDFLPDINDHETTTRFRPTKRNNTCFSTPAFAAQSFPHDRDDSWLVVKTRLSQKDSCTKRLLSYIPGRHRWFWILIAASVPHTAFGWLLVFELMFICLVWYERGSQLVTLPEEFAKESLTNKERYLRYHESGSIGAADSVIQSRRYPPLDQKTLSKYYRVGTPPASRKPTISTVRSNSTTTPPLSRKSTMTTERSYSTTTPPMSRKPTIIRLHSLTTTKSERESLGEATTALLLEAKAQITRDCPSTRTQSESDTDNHSAEPLHRKAASRQREPLPRRKLPSNVDSKFGEVHVVISEHDEDAHNASDASLRQDEP